MNLEKQRLPKEMDELVNSYKSKIEVEDKYKVNLEKKEKQEK
jgi:hypothetical protein